jgi:hypothetical protein
LYSQLPDAAALDWPLTEDDAAAAAAAVVEVVAFVLSQEAMEDDSVSTVGQAVSYISSTWRQPHRQAG